MTDKDICRFCSLIKSPLLKFDLDFNHVGPSVWSLCALRWMNLKVLSLANTDICGAAVDGLEVLLSEAKELEELDLSSNNLMVEDFEKLKLPLSNLTNLNKLNLNNSPDGISVVVQEVLPSLKYLEELRLSNVHLNGEDCVKLCESLALLKGLKHLDLSNNAIGVVGVNEVASILKDFQLLERLDMSNCYVTVDQITVLCKSLISLINLKYLNSSGNRIDIGELDEALSLPSTLEELILSDIVHGEKLFEGMTLLQHLRKLQFSDMKLSDRDANALAAMLRHVSLMEELVLTDIAAKYVEIFSAIKSLKKLKKLDLNHLRLPDCRALGEMLSSLSSLQELILSGIEIEERNYDVILENTKLLKNLKKLDFGHCVPTFCTVSCDVLSPLLLLEEIVFPNEFHLENINALQSLKYLKKLFISLSYNILRDVAAVLPSLQLLEILVLNDIWSYGDDDGDGDGDGNGDDDDDDDGDYDDDVVALFTALKSLKYLKELELEGSGIFKKATVRALAEVLPSQHLLVKLVLKENGCLCDSIEQLFLSLKSFKYLKELHLQAMESMKNGGEGLAEVLPSLRLLEKLTLIYCVGDCKQLFVSLKSLKYLRELHLEGIKTDVEALAEVLPSLPLLEMLVLFCCVGDCEQLFVALKSSKYLKELHLAGGEIDVGTLAEVLPSLQLLETLALIDCVNVDCELFVSQDSLKYLKELHLEAVKIDGEALAEVLPSLMLLEKFVFDFCLNNENEIIKVIAALKSSKYLKILSLSCCNKQVEQHSLAEVLPP